MKMHKPIGLYVHIPFCRSKCAYCDFHSGAGTAAQQDQYLAALLDEITTNRRAADFFPAPEKNYALATVYLGGGTPSYFGGDRIAAVLQAIHTAYPVQSDAEITVEANPASATPEFFAAVAAAGANRVSLGLQSAIDRERKLLGRLSDAEAARQAVFAARAAGIENISLDLMYGIPEQTLDSLTRSIRFCANLGVPHISAYMLKLEENTPFYRRRDSLKLPDEDTQCDMYALLLDELHRCGYRQYEISNFAVPGFESRHNMNYWQCGEYLGVGAAAHSFIGGKRFYYPANTDGFIAGNAPVFDGAGGTPEEFIMLALRLADGVRYDAYEKYFHAPFPDAYLRAARQKKLQPHLSFTEKGFRLTEKGFLLSNTVIAAVLFDG